MKLRISIFVFLFFSINCIAQQNLVSNYSFEDTISCPDAIGQLNKSIGWYNPSSNTPDFYHSCHVYGPPWFSNVDVPGNIMGFQFANSGEAYSAFALFNYFQSIEYIGGTLISELDSLKMYEIEFYVSLSDSANLAVDRIGLVFTSNQYFESTLGKLNLQSSIENTTIIDNDTGWTKISGTYLANGTEQYFIIGLFRDTSEFSWDTTRYNPMGGYGAYYYVDDVSVTEILDTTDTVNPIDSSLFEFTIFPNPSNGEFTLNYQMGTYAEGIFRMYDAIGKLVYEEELIQFNGTRNIEISLSSGVYVWEVMSGDAVLKREKMVIQR